MKNAFCVIVDDSTVMTRIISMAIFPYVDLEVKTFHTANEAINFIQENPTQVKLIISDYNMPGKNGGAFFLSLQENNIKTTFITCTAEDIESLKEFKEKKVNEDFFYISKPFTSQQLVQLLKKVLSDDLFHSKEEYVFIDKDRFLDFYNDEHTFPIHIKISDNKIIKLNHLNESLGIENLQKYIDKGLKGVYLTERDFLKFSKIIYKDLYQDEISLEKSIKAQLDSVESIHETLSMMNVGPALIGIAEKIVSSTIKDAMKIEHYEKIVNELLSATSFPQQLAILTSYISVILAKNFSWCDNKQLSKLAFASIFQDVSLNQLEFINNNTESLNHQSASFQKLTKEQQKIILQHPIDSISQIDAIQFCSTDIKKIIETHHEHPDGTGYPKKLKEPSLSPLSSIFIVAREFSHSLITKGLNKETVSNIKKEISESYNIGKFQKVVEVLNENF